MKTPKQSAVDALFARKPNWPADNRTEARRMQHELWQQLGTLHRMQVNLQNIIQELPTQEYVFRSTLGSAVVVIQHIITQKRIAMQNLPNKKRKALLTKGEKCVECKVRKGENTS